MKYKDAYNRSLILAIVLLLFFIILVTGISLYQFDKVKSSSKLVEHTQEVLLHSEKLMSYTIDKSRYLKEYLLNKENATKEHIEQLKALIKNELFIIRQLTINNPIQKERIDSINVLIDLRADILNRIFNYYKQKDNNSKQLINDEQMSESFVYRIRDYISLIQNTEINLLNKTKSANNASIQKLEKILEIAILGALILLVFVIQKIRNDFNEKKETADLFKTLNKELQEHLAFKSSILNETKNDLTEMLNTMTEGYIALDRNWKYTYANKRIYEFTNRIPESLIGKNIWEEFPDAIDSETYKIFHKVMEEKIYMSNIDYYAPNDFWQENHVYPSKDGIFVFIRNITKKKRAEIALQKSLRLLQDYQFAIDQSSIVSMVDSAGKIIYVNENFANISGYSTDELIGINIMDINVDFRSDSHKNKILKYAKSGKVWKGEILIKSKEGEDFWLYTTIIPFLNTDDKPYQFLTISFNITEKRMADQRIINTLTENKIILESIDDPFYALNKDWVIIYCNSFAETLLFKNRENLIGKNIMEVIPDLMETNFYQYFLDASNGKGLKNIEHYSIRLNHWYNINIYPYENGFTVYFKDITTRKLAEIQLLDLNKTLIKKSDELIASNKELEQFAYIASHDLQEPLRMITSYLTMIEKKYSLLLDDKGKTYISYAVDGGRRMRQIILDLLDFSRVGRKAEQLEAVNLNDLINEIKILFHQLISEKKAKIIADQLPIIVAYKAPLRQVFQNIINNALKYSKEAQPCNIEIHYSETITHWQFSITDNGIGIESEYFDQIFVIFHRLHNREQYSGTGIGLAITKKIIENMGGSIWVESELDNGSTFYFTILKKINNESDRYSTN